MKDHAQLREPASVKHPSEIISLTSTLGNSTPTHMVGAALQQIILAYVRTYSYIVGMGINSNNSAVRIRGSSAAFSPRDYSSREGLSLLPRPDLVTQSRESES